MTLLSDAPTFDSIFDSYVASRTEDRERDDRLHPSSLYFCDRRVVYDIRLTPREETAGSKRPLLVGKVLHEEMQAALELAVGKTIKQLFIEGHVDDPDTLIRGNFDALVQYMDDTWELLELKSANGKAIFWNRKKGEAKSDHVNQGLSYIHVVRNVGFTYEPSGFEVDESDFMCPNCITPWKCNGPHEPIEVVRVHGPIPDLDRLRVVYFDKDKHDIQEFLYTYSDQWRSELETHIAKLMRYRVEGSALPPRLPRDSWQCASEDGVGKWCPYFDRCQNIDGEGVSL